MRLVQLHFSIGRGVHFVEILQNKRLKNNLLLLQINTMKRNFCKTASPGCFSLEWGQEKQQKKSPAGWSCRYLPGSGVLFSLSVRVKEESTKTETR